MEKAIFIRVNIILLLFLLSTGFAQNVYFVAKDGDDSNPGTFEQSLKTVRYAVDKLSAGDTLNIKAGTYSEEIIITNSGTQNAPIIIKNYGDGEVNIDATGKSVGFEFNSCAYIIIHGLKIFGATKRLPYTDQGNIRFYNNPSNITIQECEIYNGTRGIRYSNNSNTPEAHYISIIGCQIHDNELEGIYMNSATKNGGSNVVISGNDVYGNGTNGIYANCNGVLIEANNVYNNNERGIRLSQSSVQSFHNSIIRRNHIYNNGKDGIMQIQAYTLIYENDIHHNGLDFTTAALHGIYMAQAGYNIIYNNKIYNHKDGSAIRLEGYYNVIRDNEFYNNGYGLGPTNLYGDSYGNIIRNNRIYNNVASSNKFNWPVGSGMEADGNEGLHLLHNVFFNSEGFGAAFVKGHRSIKSTGIKIKNNIIANSDWQHVWIEDASGYEEDYNDICPDKPDAIKYGSTTYNLSNYKSISSQGTHSISQDPLFVDPGNNNFHLQSSSQCIDAGGFLTRTTSPGSGTQIPLEDVMWFTDGHGIHQGDLIQLEGQNQTARIIEIDYDNNIITINNSFTWTNGQGVSLLYNGTAPDIGLFEYTGETSLSANIVLSDPSPTKSGDVIVTLTTNRPVIRVPTSLSFMESDGTISTIDLSGNIPGKKFSGLFVVDSTVANGKGYLFLPEGGLEDEYGNLSNLITSDVSIIIDQIAPEKPKNVVGIVIE